MEQKQYGHTAPAKSNEDDKGIVTSDMQGEVERAGTVQPEKEKAHGQSYQYV